MKNIKHVKIFIVILLFFGLSAGFFYFRTNKIADSVLARVEQTEVEIAPQNIDIGTVVMRKGKVTREYEIKNNSSNPLRLKKIATSCMCTKAQIQASNKKSRFYAMEMGGVLNPIIDFDIPAKSTAKLLVRFDPAAHGIKGVGPVERSVNLQFVDPIGTKTVGFRGEVVLK